MIVILVLILSKTLFGSTFAHLFHLITFVLDLLTQKKLLSPDIHNKYT